MKLLFVIISKEDVDQVTSALNKEGYRATKIASSGGFLKRKNVTLMIGIEEEKMDDVIDIVKGICHERQTVEVNMPIFFPNGMNEASFSGYPETVEVGGAIIFAVDVSHYEKI